MAMVPRRPREGPFDAQHHRPQWHVRRRELRQQGGGDVHHRVEYGIGITKKHCAVTSLVMVF